MTTNGIHSATVLHGDEYMRLYANGMIGRRIDGAANYGQPSFNWRVTGAQEYDKFGRPNGLHYSLEDVLYTRIEWKFKNGNQRVHITDYDHGTWRVWGSPKHEVYPIQRPDLLNPVQPWHEMIVCFGNMPVQVSGPHKQSSLAYGRVGMVDAAPTLHRREWFIKWHTWTLVKPEPDPEYERLYGPGTITIPYPEFKEHIAHIISYDSNSDRCLVGNTWPTFEDQSLDALIRRLVVKGEKPKYMG